MQVAFDALELRDAWLDSDASARWRLHLALGETTGTQSCSLIYFELDPGCRLPRHTDSAEEIVLILSGSAVVKIAEYQLDVEADGLVVIPQDAPHELRNSGPTVLRAVGFFATASPPGHRQHRDHRHRPRPPRADGPRRQLARALTPRPAAGRLATSSPPDLAGIAGHEPGGERLAECSIHREAAMRAA
jgi:mannose-6-phosphate isomerase-like protein (cupin superfamily)